MRSVARIGRRGVVGFIGATLCFVASAQSTRPTLRFVVPTSPGSAADIGARVVADAMLAANGQPVVVDNRLGAGGSIAAKAVAGAAPDGQTLGLLGGTYLLIPVEFPNIGFDPKVDLLPVALIGHIPNVLVVSTTSPYTTLKALLDDAKARPGELNVASAGIGSSTFWSGERLRLATRIDVTHVPFKGSPEVVNEILAGRVAYGFVPAPVALPMAKAGRLRPLAVSSSKRSILFAEVPTTAEAGVADSTYDGFLVATVPKGTPGDVQAALNRQIGAALSTADVVARLRQQGVESEPMDLDALRSFIACQYDTALALAKATKSAGR